MKYGTAIGKSINKLTEQQQKHLTETLSNFAKANNLVMEYTPEQDSWKPYQRGAMTHKFVFKPVAFTTNKLFKLGKVKPSTLWIAHDSPKIYVILDYCHSQCEDTKEWVDQFHFYVRTSGLFKRGYRCKRWECFDEYKSFDYETEVENITASIVNSLKQIVTVYKPLFG